MPLEGRGTSSWPFLLLYSPNVGEVGFYEVRLLEVLPDAYCKVSSSQSYATRWKRTCAPPSQWPSAPSSAVNTT